MGQKNWTDDEILEFIRYKIFENEAFKYILIEWGDYIEKQLNKIWPIDDEVNIIISDFFLRLRRKVQFENFSPDTATLKTYITRALMNEWYWYNIRKKKNEEKMRKLREEMILFARDEGIAETQAMDILNSMIQQLDQKCKEILLMIQKGMKLREVSEIFNQTVEHIKARKKKCLDKMRKMIPNNVK